MTDDQRMLDSFVQAILTEHSSISARLVGDCRVASREFDAAMFAMDADAGARAVDSLCNAAIDYTMALLGEIQAKMPVFGDIRGKGMDNRMSIGFVMKILKNAREG